MRIIMYNSSHTYSMRNVCLLHGAAPPTHTLQKAHNFDLDKAIHSPSTHIHLIVFLKTLIAICDNCYL